MIKILTMLTAIAAVLGLATFSPTISDAYRGDPAMEGPNYSTERHDQMEQALETNDYQTWKELMGNRGRVAEVITEDNFPQFVKAHQLSEEGKIGEAQELRQALGLGNYDGQERGFGGNCNR